MLVRTAGTSPSRAPSLDLDLYSRAVVEEPDAAFGAIRAAGPVVWLPRHRMWAMGRFEDVRAALRADDVFLSGTGVAGNRIANALGRDTVLSSDGETHTARRRVLMRSLGAKALAPVQGRVDAQAEQLVDELVRRRSFDGVRDFASRLPVSVVADLVGVRVSAAQMLRWAAGTFNSLGPLNRRAIAAAPASLGLARYTARVGPSSVEPGSWAASVLEAADSGELTPREARTMVIDFVAPSLDTTILAAGHMLWRMACTPGAWDAIRADQSLIPAAVVESVRLASPVRGFTRRLARDHEVGGTVLPRGARVVLLFASANRDERRFAQPDRFDLHRENGSHVGWGNGPHTCVGIHLAKLEMQALLRAMVPRVRVVEAGSPRRLRNNTLQGFTSFRARFLP
jgi:cytochrome P450